MSQYDPKEKDRQAGAGPVEAAAPTASVFRHPTVGCSIWAVGGGKGGVGKSFVAANVAAKLSRQGQSVLLVDADFGAANLHTLLAVGPSRGSITSFLRGRTDSLAGLVHKTPVPNLDILDGAMDPLDAADIKMAAVERLGSALKGLPYDFVIVDTGPGTSSTVIELFSSAAVGVTVVSPEPTAIENTYRFFKCVFLSRVRKIMNAEGNRALRKNLQQIFSHGWNERIRTFGDIFSELSRLEPAHASYLREVMERNKTFIVVNKARTPEDEQLGHLIKRASRDYFDIEIGFLGAIGADDRVEESVRKRKLLSVHDSTSRASIALDECLERLNRTLRRKTASR